MVGDIEFVVYVDSQGVEHLAIVTNDDYESVLISSVNDPIETRDLFLFDTGEHLKGVSNASLINAWKPFQFPQEQSEEQKPTN